MFRILKLYDDAPGEVVGSEYDVYGDAVQAARFMAKQGDGQEYVVVQLLFRLRREVIETFREEEIGPGMSRVSVESEVSEPHSTAFLTATERHLIESYRGGKLVTDKEEIATCAKLVTYGYLNCTAAGPGGAYYELTSKWDTDNGETPTD